jgi:hypothetical protein
MAILFLLSLFTMMPPLAQWYLGRYLGSSKIPCYLLKALDHPKLSECKVEYHHQSSLSGVIVVGVSSSSSTLDHHYQHCLRVALSLGLYPQARRQQLVFTIVPTSTLSLLVSISFFEFLISYTYDAAIAAPSYVCSHVAHSLSSRVSRGTYSCWGCRRYSFLTRPFATMSRWSIGPLALSSSHTLAISRDWLCM